MSNRRFFIARTETGENQEPFDCGVYSLATEWSHAPLRMRNEDRAAFERRLAHGCDDWARLHCEFRPRFAGTHLRALWCPTASFDATDSASDEQLAEIESD